MHMFPVGAAMLLAVPAPKGKPTLIFGLACKLSRRECMQPRTTYKSVKRRQAYAAGHISHALLSGAGVATSP